MSETITGVIEYVNERTHNGTKYYNVKVNGVYYGLGKYPPKAAKGDTVTFTADQNDAGYWNAKGLKKVEGQAAPARKNAPASTAVASGREDYWQQKAVDDKVKDKYIRACWAIQEANKFALAAQAQGLLAVPAKAKPEQIREQVLTLADELATVFLGRVEALANGKTSTAPSEPVGEDGGEEAPPDDSGDDENWQ